MSLSVSQHKKNHCVLFGPEGTIELVSKGFFVEEHGLQETEAVGQVTLIAARLAVPGRPVDALAAGVPDAVLELAPHLTFEHRPQHSIGLIRLIQYIVGGQKMQNVAGRDSAVHVLAEGICPVLSLRDPDGIRKKVIASPHRFEHRRDPQVEAFEPDLVELFPEAVEDLTAEAGLD